MNCLENGITIDDLRKLCKDETINLTQHFQMRCKERKISLKDVKNAILTGEIIEIYKDDYLNPSCLVLGNAINKKALHIVVGIGNNFLWLITAYYPNEVKWTNNYKNRKGE